MAGEREWTLMTDSANGASADTGRPTRLLPVGHLIRISLYWLGLTAIDGAVGLFIQNRLNFGPMAVDPLEIGRTLFLISIPVGVISILVQPTVGSISDYTISRWGRRKPYIVVGSLLDLVFLYGIATSNTVLMLAVFAGLLSFSTNIARGPFQGYVPDLVSDKQVGLASAMVGLMQILGNVVGFLSVTVAVLADRIELAIAAVALIELVTMAAVVLRVEPGRPPKDRAGRSWASVAGETWGTDVLRERSYVWLLTSRFFFLMGGAVLVNLLITYLKQSHGMGEDAANGTYTIALILVVLGNLVAIVPSARISDRIGRKPVIYASCAIGFVGISMAALAPAVPLAIVGATLFGASAGTFLAVDWALMTDIIPRASSGRYMGLSNVATTASTIFAVMTGGLVIDAVNAAIGIGAGPRAAFLLGAAYYVIAGLTLRPVEEPVRRGAPPVAATAEAG
jgi:MFS family permease